MNRNDIKKIFGYSLQNEIDTFTNESKHFDKPLYHYTKIETLDSILRSRKLRLSHYQNLNDEMEIKHAFDITLNLINEYINNTQHINFWKYFYECFQYINNYLEFYVCSFSEKYNNTTLWNIYADNAQGICIGFRPNYFKSVNNIKKAKNKLIVLEKVHYHENEFNIYIINLFEIIDRTLKNKIANFTSNLYPSVASELAIFILPIIPKLKQSTSKHGEVWNLENEWRLYQIVYQAQFNSTLPKNAQLNPPKNKKYSEITIGQKDIFEIWLGNSCRKDLRVIQSMLHKYGFNNTNIKKIHHTS